MAEVVERAVELQAVLVVVDTLGQFAGMRGESENDAGAALAAMEPIQAATARGLGVLVLRHERKGGGVVGESARGSSAFAGAVDIVLRLARPDGNHAPEVRKIEALSRFGETPDELVIELTDDGYVSRGSASDLAMQHARAEVGSVLDDAPDGLTYDEMSKRTEDVSTTTIKRVIAEMIEAGSIVRTGAGRKNDPYRFAFHPSRHGSLVGNQDPRFEDSPSPSQAVAASNHSDQTPPSMGPDQMEVLFHGQGSDLTKVARAIFGDMPQ